MVRAASASAERRRHASTIVRCRDGAGELADGEQTSAILNRDGNDDYTQAGNLFRLMDREQRGRMMDAIAGAMEGVPSEIVQRQIGHFGKADPAYGQGVADRLGVDMGKVP